MGGRLEGSAQQKNARAGHIVSASFVQVCCGRRPVPIWKTGEARVGGNESAEECGCRVHC